MVLLGSIKVACHENSARFCTVTTVDEYGNDEDRDDHEDENKWFSMTSASTPCDILSQSIRGEVIVVFATTRSSTVIRIMQ